MKLTVISKPYDDENLKFNENTNRYELTLEFCHREFDCPFADDGVLERRIKKNSRKIYNELYSRGYSGNRQAVEFLLHRTLNGRKFLLELLAVQMEADCDSGYNDLTQQPAINLSGGKDVDRMELVRNSITVDAEKIIEQSMSYFGVSIVCPTLYDQWVLLFTGRF